MLRSGAWVVYIWKSTLDLVADRSLEATGLNKKHGKQQVTQWSFYWGERGSARSSPCAIPVTRQARGSISRLVVATYCRAAGEGWPAGVSNSSCRASSGSSPSINRPLMTHDGKACTPASLQTFATSAPYSTAAVRTAFPFTRIK